MPVGPRSPQIAASSTPRSRRPACAGTGATSTVSGPCLRRHYRTSAWLRTGLSFCLALRSRSIWAPASRCGAAPVSYTHLTLPTICSV
eukprot:12972954-Alexandrium_andersonii.AAC.1